MHNFVDTYQLRVLADCGLGVVHRKLWQHDGRGVNRATNDCACKYEPLTSTANSVMAGADKSVCTKHSWAVWDQM